MRTLTAAETYLLLGDGAAADPRAGARHPREPHLAARFAEPLHAVVVLAESSARRTSRLGTTVESAGPHARRALPDDELSGQLLARAAQRSSRTSITAG